MSKLKVGDWVEVLDTKNVRHYDPRGRGIGFQFEIEKDWIFGTPKNPIYIPNGNKYSINYDELDLKIIKKPNKKMATKKQTGLQLKDGMFFTANYN